MNRSYTSPRSFSTDQLHVALGDVGGPARPDYLTDLVAQAGRKRQRPAWTFLERWLSMDIAVRRQGVPRTAVVFAALSLLVALLAAGVVYIGSQLIQPERPPRLPSTPDAWQRILIETPEVTGSVVSLAASPHGLLAVVGEDWRSDVARLAVSTDGQDWTLVPETRQPKLSAAGGFGPPFGYPSVVGTDRGFLLVQRRLDALSWLGEVWMSEDAYSWRRLTGEITDPDLSMVGPETATVGGPGLVALGGDKAVYSVDGSDWSVAAVPALPEEILARPDSERYVEMTGVTTAGNGLVAWGIASVPRADNSGEHVVVPLLWASHDGRTWGSVADPQMDSVMAVSGAPSGFIAAGEADGALAAWFSADGQSWEMVDVLEPRSPMHVELKSAAGSNAGYVLVGGDPSCFAGSCSPSAEVAIWTSPDGRSWSQLPSDERFSRAGATHVVAFGSHFVVGGGHDGKPAIWISDPGRAGGGTNATSASAEAIPTQTPGQPVSLAGSWQATDPPPDRSHLTMDVVAMPNGSYEVTIRDDFASVCDGVSSTMTGVAKTTDSGTIVIEQPEYVCDDGSHAQALSGPPLDEQLRNFTFTYDYWRDAFDGGGLEWTRMAGQ
jgi:hypothetical protein